MNQIIATVLVLIGLTSVASADPKRPTPVVSADEAAQIAEQKAYEHHYQAGHRLLQKAVTSSDYRLALAEFKAAELLPHAVTSELLMAIAKCHEEIGEYAQAIQYYQFVQGLPKQDDQAVAKATLRIKILEARIAELDAVPPPPKKTVLDLPPEPAKPEAKSGRGTVRQAAYIGIIPSALLTAAGATLMGVAWNKRQSLLGTYPTPQNQFELSEAHSQYNMGSGILGVGSFLVALDVGMFVCAFAFGDHCP